VAGWRTVDDRRVAPRQRHCNRGAIGIDWELGPMGVPGSAAVSMLGVPWWSAGLGARLARCVGGALRGESSDAQVGACRSDEPQESRWSRREELEKWASIQRNSFPALPT